MRMYKPIVGLLHNLLKNSNVSSGIGSCIAKKKFYFQKLSVVHMSSKSETGLITAGRGGGIFTSALRRGYVIVGVCPSVRSSVC